MADVAAHITGTVWKIEVKVGQTVAAGDTLVILESMKMEMPVEAPEGGTVKEIRCKEAQAVNEGDVLVVLSAVTSDGRLERSRTARRDPGADAGAAAAAERPDALPAGCVAEALAPDPSVRALVLGGPRARRSAPATTSRSSGRMRPPPAAGRADPGGPGVLEAHPAPSVALVHGAAFGAGCELACACDFRVGTPDTVLCMPPARLGVVYAPDGVWRVARLAGVQRARWMFLTAAEVGASEALAWGLLDEVTDEGPPRARAGDDAGLGCTAGDGRAPPDAARRSGGRRSPPRSRGARGVEGGGLRVEDAVEARTAMREKRPPRWKGR